jgi:surface polysaccharide O-acyltransferase-like enzyme
MHIVKQTTQNRNISIDLLRIAATLGVIILHVSVSKWYDTPVKSIDWQIMNIYGSLPRWVIPIFVMISGRFHLRPNENGITFKEEMKIIYRKIFRIICAIIFWGVVYNGTYIVCKYFIKNETVTVFDIMKISEMIILGPAWYHLWFLYMLIGLYLLTPIFRRIINHTEKNCMEYILVLYFIIGTCIPLINIILTKLPIFMGRTIYFPVAELSGYIGYYIAGYYFSNNKLKDKTKTGFYCLAVLSILITIIGTSFMSIYKNKPVGYLYGYLLPTTMLIAYALFIFFNEKIGQVKFSRKTEKIISRVSKYTFGIYLIHALVIQIFDIIGLNILIITPILSIPIISIMVFIVSEIGTIIINKIPVINKYIV